jgi:tetratricopeptide (TPR) repeat protein
LQHPVQRNRSWLRSLAVGATLCVLLPASARGQDAAQSPAAQRQAQAANLRAAIDSLSPDGHTTALAEAYNSLGLHYWTESRFESALAHLRYAHTVWSALGDTVGLGRVHNNIGVVYYQWGQYEPALESYKRSLAMRRHLRDHRGVALVLTNIGRTYLDLQLLERARPVLEEAAVAADHAADPAAQGYARHNLGLMHLEAGNLVEARRLFEESMALYHANDPRLTASDSFSGWALNTVALGLLHVREGDARTGIGLLEEVLASAESDDHARRQAYALLQLGRAYRSTGEAALAVGALERGHAIASAAAQRSLALEILGELAHAHEASGDTRSALSRFRAHAALRDSVFSQNTLTRIVAAELREEADRQEAENNRLRQEQQIQEAVIARQRVGGLLGGALLLVSALLVMALVHHNRTGRARQQVLADTNAALEQSNNDLRAAISEVRTLKGFIPICSHCKKIRDDAGFWQAVETYISERSGRQLQPRHLHGMRAAPVRQ